MGLIQYIESLIPYGNREPTKMKVKVDMPKKTGAVEPPSGRKSTIDLPNLWMNFEKEAKFLSPEKYIELIPHIRRSYPFIQNLALAIQDMVQLTNTGHEVYFDNKMPLEKVEEMRAELKRAAIGWTQGGAGLDALVNKMITQVYIGGAISTEWVPENDLSGIETVGFIKPETIEVKVGKRNMFVFYQKPRNWTGNPEDPIAGLIKLNPLTYKYVGIPGDTDDPRGVPPLVSALEDLGIQREMMTNIRFIVNQVGILGFIELLMDKPPQNKNENETAYTGRLKALLRTAKENILKGTKDGVLVGYEGDHEYNFHSTTANVSGLGEVFGINQKMVANGLKYSGSFMGNTEGSDTNIGIVFTKMLSQLKNIQLLVSAVLEFGYTQHLLLKGFTFKNLTVEFKPSTISDDLKIQQGMEIKIRNYRTLYADGVISMETYAEEMGYESPDQKKPRIPIVPKGSKDPEQKEKREKQKDDSDRRVRDKNKPQPKRRDNETKTP